MVKIHTRAGLSSMYYQLGTLTDHKIEWKAAIFVGTGAYPKIAINDDNQVILVYEGNFFRDIYYRVGQANGDVINWGEEHLLCGGRYPTVALRNDGRFVIAFESKYTYGTSYITGQISAEHQKIVDRSHPSLLFQHSVSELSLTMNEKNCIVAAGRMWNFQFIFKVGKIQLENTAFPLSWGEERTSDQFKGYCPTIGMNDAGQLVSMQQSVLGRQLTYRLGQVNFDAKEVRWSGNAVKNYDLGCNPTLAMKNDGTIVEVHETNFSMLGLMGNRLFYHIGSILG